MPKKGPYVDPQAAEAMSRGANQSGGSPIAFAGRIAQDLSKAYGQKPQLSNGGMTNVDDPSLLSYENAAEANPHVMAMQQAAEDAKRKYMLENGVDENGDPIKK